MYFVRSLAVYKNTGEEKRVEIRESIGGMEGVASERAAPRSLLEKYVKENRARRETVHGAEIVRFRVDGEHIAKQLTANQNVDPAKLLPLLAGTEQSKKDGNVMPCAAVLTGSFPLWVMEGCPEAWSPGDVDVFSSSPHDVWRFRQTFGPETRTESEAQYYQHYANVVAREACDRLQGRSGTRVRHGTAFKKAEYLDDLAIVSVHTWEGRSKAGRPFKVQLIRVGKDVEEHILRNFDIPAARLWFDGVTLSTPVVNLLGNEFDIDQTRFDTTLQFDRLLRRCNKYAARGYSFKLPPAIKGPPCCAAVKLIYSEEQGEGQFYCPTACHAILRIRSQQKEHAPWFLKLQPIQFDEAEGTGGEERPSKKKLEAVVQPESTSGRRGGGGGGGGGGTAGVRHPIRKKTRANGPANSLANSLANGPANGPANSQANGLANNQADRAVEGTEPRTYDNFMRAVEQSMASHEPFSFQNENDAAPTHYVWQKRRLRNGNLVWCPVPAAIGAAAEEEGGETAVDSALQLGSKTSIPLVNQLTTKHQLAAEHQFALDGGRDVAEAEASLGVAFSKKEEDYEGKKDDDEDDGWVSVQNGSSGALNIGVRVYGNGGDKAFPSDDAF